MNISTIMDQIVSPKPYVRGTDMMWTDPHISKYLLEAHLNPNSGAASRTLRDIQETVDVIDRMIERGSKILDLGCGPGLYTERLREKGHHITGVDLSERSIAYAKEQDRHNEITYIHENYLNVNLDSEFDLILMIYCDFGALVPEEREAMIGIIKKALKPNGVFLFDAIDEGTVDRLSFGSSWEMTKGGFYSPDPYLCLTERFHFPEFKATLDQHIVLQEDDTTKLYRFWNHYFNKEDVIDLFLPFGFTSVDSVRGVLKGDEAYHDEGVVFYAIRNG